MARHLTPQPALGNGVPARPVQVTYSGGLKEW